MKNFMKKALNDLIRWETWWLEKGASCESPVSAFFCRRVAGDYRDGCDFCNRSRNQRGIRSAYQEIDREKIVSAAKGVASVMPLYFLKGDSDENCGLLQYDTNV